MNKEIETAFVDVRTAFRLLKEYQERIIQIVHYIKEQIPDANMWGKRWYTPDLIKKQKCPSGYANLRVDKNTDGLFFYPSYLFEFFLGQLKLGKSKIVEMSIFEISDDGWTTSDEAWNLDFSSFRAPEASNSYLLFNLAFCSKIENELWLENPECPDDSWYQFLRKVVSSSHPLHIFKNDKGSISVLKKYEMARFSSQEETDRIIADFAKIVKEHCGVELVKKESEKK